MKKTEKIELDIFNFLNKNWAITVDQILKSKKAIKTDEDLKKLSRKLIEEIKSGNIKHLKYIEDDSNVINHIVDIFPIGLHELSPSDFEGDDPMSIEDMLKIASKYIFEDIISHRIDSLKIKI